MSWNPFTNPSQPRGTIPIIGETFGRQVVEVKQTKVKNRWGLRTKEKTISVKYSNSSVEEGSTPPAPATATQPVPSTRAPPVSSEPPPYTPVQPPPSPAGLSGAQTAVISSGVTLMAVYIAKRVLGGGAGGSSKGEGK